MGSGKSSLRGVAQVSPSACLYPVTQLSVLLTQVISWCLAPRLRSNCTLTVSTQVLSGTLMTSKPDFPSLSNEHTATCSVVEDQMRNASLDLSLSSCVTLHTKVCTVRRHKRKPREEKRGAIWLNSDTCHCLEPALVQISVQEIVIGGMDE